MARIHYWELSSYNSGKLIGKWFDLDSADQSSHADELSEWMEELTEETGALCEEWIVGDSEGIPDKYVDEYSIDPEFFDYMRALEDSGLDADVFEAGLYLGIPVDKIAGAYEGFFRSDADYAWDIVESLGVLYGADKILSVYFDYEAFGRDLMINDAMEHNGHYFRR